MKMMDSVQRQPSTYRPAVVCNKNTCKSQWAGMYVQMDSSSVPIAIGEPIGGGLFVSNVVLGAVCFIAGGASGAVHVEKKTFLRETLFYAGAMLVVGLVLHDEQVLCSSQLRMLFMQYHP